MTEAGIAARAQRVVRLRDGLIADVSENMRA